MDGSKTPIAAFSDCLAYSEDHLSSSSDVLPQLTASSLVRDSWGFLKNHPKSLVAIAAFPFALSIILGGASLVAADVGLSQPLLTSATTILGIVPLTLFGVAWHRLVLIGEPSSPSVSMTWSRTHTSFALFLLFWSTFWLLTPSSLLTPDPESQADLSTGAKAAVFVWFGFMVIWLYLQARFSLFLPATSIGKPLKIRQAWEQSRSYGGVIFWAEIFSGIFGSLISIPLIVASDFVAQRSSPLAQLSAVVLGSATPMVISTLVVGSLSFAYKGISQRREVLSPSLDRPG